MKRLAWTMFGPAAVSAAVSLLLVAGWNYRSEQFNELLGSQICTAVTPRAQVGGSRDAFDQAYSILRISNRAEKSFATFQDGEAEYGQHPSSGDTAYQSVTCQIEGRPDMKLTLYFEKASVIGWNWVGLTIAILTTLSLLGFVLHAFSSRLVKIVQAQLSSGMSLVLAGKVRSRGGGRIFDSILESTPAIRRLRSELAEKRRLSAENSAYQSEVANLLNEHSKRELKEKTTVEIVSQVRHDLRSPLSFLKVFGQTLHGDNIETYHLSVERIDRILRDLNQVAGAEVRLKNAPELCLIECTLQETVAAKKASWDRGTAISFKFDSQNLNAASVDPIRFGRIIDNILQNALEAAGESGEIFLESRRIGEYVEVIISDNGPGIPSDILDRLGKERISFGKNGGNGIGLYTANQWIETWGGTLVIESKQGLGTTIIMRLPRLDLAAKFVAEITLGPGQELVILDDELEAANKLIKQAGGRGRYFSSVADYVKWLDEVDLSDKKILSIYDLHLNPGSGLDLLRIHPWPHGAILYTSDYLNPEALELSSELGFSILPKIFVGA